MLKTKWLMLTLSGTLLFTTSAQSSIMPFQPTTRQLIENKVDKNGMVKTNGFGIIENPVITKLNKLKEENNKKKAEEEKLKKEKEYKEQNKEPQWREQTFILTYYGATYNECGNNKFVTASGIPVQEGHIAVPKEIPFGSKIIINGNEYIATDRGNPKYICILNNGYIRVDIFVSRRSGESTHQYEKRISKMGTQKVNGKILIKE